MAHFTEQCSHGQVYNTCRCMGPNKEIRIVPCKDNRWHRLNSKWPKSNQWKVSDSHGLCVVDVETGLIVADMEPRPDWCEVPSYEQRRAWAEEIVAAHNGASNEL